MSAAVAVRLIGPDDAPSLAALHRQCFPDCWSAETFEALLVRPYVKAWGIVVNPESRLRGFILIQVIADEAEVLTFCVEPDVRGRKLGAALLATAALSAGNMDASRMFLEVSENNAAARRLYEQQGFVVVGRRAAYYRGADQPQQGVDALVMRKSLPAGPASSN